jgi:cytochrome c oxidase assembly factor CtaG
MDDPRTLLFWTAGLMLALAAFAALAEHRRTKRRDVDRPGWVPWNLIQVVAFLTAMAAAALALRS